MLPSRQSSCLLLASESINICDQDCKHNPTITWLLRGSEPRSVLLLGTTEKVRLFKFGKGTRVFPGTVVSAPCCRRQVARNP
ncbi:hypothetical protein WAI453_003234 [Rhynchosporium graminicola]